MPHLNFTFSGESYDRQSIQPAFRFSYKMRQRHSKIEIDVSELKTDVSELKTDVSQLKSDVSELKIDVSTLKSDMSEVKADVSELKSDVSELKTGQNRIEKQIRLNNAAVNEMAGEQLRINSRVTELEKTSV
jgi:chromosome segregation ATPase